MTKELTIPEEHICTYMSSFWSRCTNGALRRNSLDSDGNLGFGEEGRRRVGCSFRPSSG